ncbi:hypothetical protein [Iodobacter sp.]|uniref:hypothetical protein n=1 Tax=Iodobacter sp. TaxID=1915058 RepID=UPI0025D1A610|nr:hypothetical protein [Iodobacter sp.]
MSNAPQRLLLLCKHSGERNLALDQACYLLRKYLKRPWGLLALSGGLLSNINVLENLWLIPSWQNNQSSTEILTNLQSILSQLNINEQNAAKLLVARPANLSNTETRVALLLRALLLSPEILLIDHDWFLGLKQVDRDLYQRALPLLAHCDWWVFSDDIEAPSNDAAWSTQDALTFLAEQIPSSS